jgi:hypothetical protein
MADNESTRRLQQLEARLAALESGGSGAARPNASSSQSQSPSQSKGPSPFDAAQVQAFLQGAVMGASVAAQATSAQGEGEAPAFLSIWGCDDGGGGWQPTNYDSFFWCESRFFCNPDSLSCLC